MNSLVKTRAGWNEQALSSNDPGSQVARPTTSGEAPELISDIRNKLRLEEPTESILDVGCGNAFLLSGLADSFNRIAGVDYSDSMIESARKILPMGNFLVGEASPLPFGDNSFDRVLCYSIFHYFPGADYALQAIREMVRVCSPGGLILIGDLLDNTFEQQIKGGSDLEYEKTIPVIHRYSTWRFYDLEALQNQIKSLAVQVEILSQPDHFPMGWYRKDLRICL